MSIDGVVQKQDRCEDQDRAVPASIQRDPTTLESRTANSGRVQTEIIINQLPGTGHFLSHHWIEECHQVTPLGKRSQSISLWCLIWFMRLPEFIAAHSEQIMQEWIAFARTRVPAAIALDERALRNDGDSILRDVVADMGGPQSLLQQKEKSQGLRITPSGANSIPHRHATQRALHGFETLQVVSEFRALRATVLRLWMQSARSVDIHDLDDVSRFNEAIDEALADSLKVFVEEADHRRHLFMGVLGHDLRGPLHTIISCAQLFSRKHPEDTREAGMVLRSAAQVKALADDLLAFTMHGLKIDAPKALSAMRLDLFCQQTIDEIAILAPGREITFRSEGEPSGMWDGRRLHQLLWNLVVNALKYGQADQPVSVVLDGHDNDEVKLTVQNFGKPIPAEILPTLLSPLTRGGVEQTDSNLPAGANVGLGLYIANTIAEAHGGNITISSSAEEGTRFTVCLPRWSQETASRPAPDASPANSAH